MTPLPPTSPARLRVIIDPQDDRATHERMLRVGGLREGRVVYHIKPGTQGLPVLCAAVLQGLGKNPEGRGTHQSSTVNWRRCGLWLTAENVSELIALRAQWLNQRGWKHLIALAATANCGLTFVLSGCELKRWQTAMLADWPFERMTVEDWRQRYEARWQPAVSEPPSAVAEFPPIPSDDFTLFRATCRDRLSPADFAVVDNRWRAARAAAQALAQQAVLDEVTVAEFLRSEVRAARSYGEVLTVVRACQAAFFLAGWLIKVNDERLMGSVMQEPYDLLTPASADLLRTFVTPSYAAAATLALVVREPLQTLLALRCGDIARDGAAVFLRGRRLAVPAEFAVFLRAQLHEREAHGGTGDAPLLVAQASFAAQREHGPSIALTEKALKQMLRNVVRETGLLVTTDFSAVRADAESSSWMYRRGVSALPITLTLQRSLKAAS